jgi:hypothetical protein
MGIFSIFFYIGVSLYIVFILQVKLISPSWKSRNWEYYVAFQCDQMPCVGRGADSDTLCVRLWVDSRSTWTDVTCTSPSFGDSRNDNLIASSPSYMHLVRQSLGMEPKIIPLPCCDYRSTAH